MQLVEASGSGRPRSPLGKRRVQPSRSCHAVNAFVCRLTAFVVFTVHAAVAEASADMPQAQDELDPLGRRLSSHGTNKTVVTMGIPSVPKLDKKTGAAVAFGFFVFFMGCSLAACYMGYRKSQARKAEAAKAIVQFIDEDGDDIKFELCYGRLIQSINGVSFVGPDVDVSTGGCLTKLTWRPKAGFGGEVEDQAGLKINIPKDQLDKLWHLCEQCTSREGGIEHNIPAPAGYVSSKNGGATTAWQDDGSQVMPLKLGGAQSTGHTAQDDQYGV